MALEVGTVPVNDVLAGAARRRLAARPRRPARPAGREIKAEMRAAFYGDADDWKGMVAGQSLLAMRQALAFLSE